MRTTQEKSHLHFRQQLIEGKQPAAAGGLVLGTAVRRLPQQRAQRLQAGGNLDQLDMGLGSGGDLYGRVPGVCYGCIARSWGKRFRSGVVDTRSTDATQLQEWMTGSSRHV